VHDLVPRRFIPLVVVALVVAAVVLALGNFAVEEGESGSPAGFVIALVITLAVTVLVWRFLVLPASEGRRPVARDGFIVGVVAILLVLVYWTGLPWALGPAAVALGTLGREGRRPGEARTAGPDPAADIVPADPRTGTAAALLGWIALIGATVFGLLDVL
jgi:hypothetical protein